MNHQHPDPEGHLTDITLTALVKLRDSRKRLAAQARLDSSRSDYLAGTARADEQVVAHLNAILEPWGEGPVDG